MSATREGVVNPRSEMMAEVIKNREAQVAEDLEKSGVDISTLARTPEMPEGTNREEWDRLEDEGKEALVTAEAERKKAEEEAANKPADGETPEAKAEREAAEKAAAEAAKPKVKIKVDGVEQEVDEDKVREAGIRALQKESTADKRLEEAARLKKQAEEALAQARPNQDAANPPKGGSDADKLTDEVFLEAIKKVQYGGEAEAAKALQDIVTRAASSGKSEALTLAEVNEYIEFRDATKWANDEFKDVLGDPYLKSLFSMKEKELRAAGDMRPYREVYQEIGTGVREWIKAKAPTPVPPADTSKTRQERKAAIVNIPTASGRQPAPKETKEPTPSETVARMRASRFQA